MHFYKSLSIFTVFLESDSLSSWDPSKRHILGWQSDVSGRWKHVGQVGLEGQLGKVGHGGAHGAGGCGGGG